MHRPQPVYFKVRQCHPYRFYKPTGGLYAPGMRGVRNILGGMAARVDVYLHVPDGWAWDGGCASGGM